MWVFLDLPVELLLEMKRKATQEGLRISDLAEVYLRGGVTAVSPPEGLDTLPLGHESHASESQRSLGEVLMLAKIH